MSSSTPPNPLAPPLISQGAFFKFSSLPPELRQRIWKFTINDTSPFVHVRWDKKKRGFRSLRKPPAILHVSGESRAVGLKYWTLAFGSSPEFARTYYNFEEECVYFDWHSLGAEPGRLGRKIMDEECAKVKAMLINEEYLLSHAEENMRELKRFTSLGSLAIICDPHIVESGDQYGLESLEEYSEELDEQPFRGEHRWPTVACLRSDDADFEGECSRHWWFDGWNQRAELSGRTQPWHEPFANCLKMTVENDNPIFFLQSLLGLFP